MERVVDPILADVQTEYEEAMRTRRWWRAIWVCASGYSAFWKAVSLHTLQTGPRSLWSGIAGEQWTVGRMSAYSLIAFITVTLLLAAPSLIHVYPRHQSWLMLALLDLPQVIPLSIPIALPLGIVCGVYGTRIDARRIRAGLLLAIVSTLFALATMLRLPVADDIYRVALAKELDRRGISHSLQKGANAMSLSELAARSKEYEAAGFPKHAGKFRRAYHIRFALPAATFVLSLLALGICGALAGRPLRVIAIVSAVGLYWAALALAEWSTSLPPPVSAWAPNMVFTAMALALLEIPRRRFRQPAE